MIVSKVIVLKYFPTVEFIYHLCPSLLEENRAFNKSSLFSSFFGHFGCVGPCLKLSLSIVLLQVSLDRSHLVSMKWLLFFLLLSYLYKNNVLDVVESCVHNSCALKKRMTEKDLLCIYHVCS